MKKTPTFIASALGLTLAFYMAAYYMLPGDPPTAAMVGLFAAVALAIVWIVNTLWSKRSAAKAKPAPSIRGIAFWIGVVLLGLGPRTGRLRAQTQPPSTAPTIDCFANPRTLPPGGSATILAEAASPRNRPLRYSFSASAGQISGTGSMVTLSTAGAPPGTITIACNVADDQGQTASTTATVTVSAPVTASPPPPQGGGGRLHGPLPGPPSYESRGGSPALDRVTGTAILLAGKKEPAGYGLYSYALLFHPPSAAELPRYKAFVRALVDLPTAEGLAQYVPTNRINLTSIPLRQADPGWANAASDAKVAFILAHYDYARAAAIHASLTTIVGTGPVLLSVLDPIDPAERPSPVLVQDMTRAQASLMSAYVQSFVSQAAQERFWQESELSQFSLGLRNALETAAVGLGLSKDAVDGWIKYFK